MPEFKFNFDFVPVPREFIERVMPSSNPSYVMVYLYILMLAASHSSLSCEIIAKRLGMIESDVIKAIEFWRSKGLIAGSEDRIIIKKSADEELSPELEKRSYDEIAAVIESNRELGELCEISQSILGKTLAQSDMVTLYWFYDVLGFSPEVITMLLEYCASRDKRNMKYIEKVAVTWHENNIRTMEEAEKYINKQEKEYEYVSSLKKLFGIERKLSSTEMTFISDWRDKLKMSADMVGMAYEYCITSTGNLSFPYMNRILVRWAENGIFTLEAVDEDHKKHLQKQAQKYSAQKQPPANTSAMTATEDVEDIEKMFMDMYSK